VGTVAGREAKREEMEVFSAYLVKNHLKRSEQREVILDAFLRAERHSRWTTFSRSCKNAAPTSADHRLPHPQAAPRSRTRERARPAGGNRFEPDYNRAHHDHFICNSCGAIFEFMNDEVERIQVEIAASLGFTIEGAPAPDLRPVPPLLGAPERTLPAAEPRTLHPAP
jgi:Fur family ferric uptake transcriptional regulator